MSKKLKERASLEVGVSRMYPSPGDWKMNLNNLQQICVSNEVVALAKMQGDAKEDVCNAYLMAASNDMYKALREVIEYCTADDSNVKYDKEGEAILNNCIDAIVKAEGLK